MKYNCGNKDDVLEYIKKYTMKFISVNHKKNFDFNNLKYPKIFKPVIISIAFISHYKLTNRIVQNRLSFMNLATTKMAFLKQIIYMRINII